MCVCVCVCVGGVFCEMFCNDFRFSNCYSEGLFLVVEWFCFFKRMIIKNISKCLIVCFEVRNFFFVNFNISFFLYFGDALLFLLVGDIIYTFLLSCLFFILCILSNCVYVGVFDCLRFVWTIFEVVQLMKSLFSDSVGAGSSSVSELCEQIRSNIFQINNGGEWIRLSW